MSGFCYSAAWSAGYDARVTLDPDNFGGFDGILDMFGGARALVPAGVDDCNTSAPFLYLMMTTFAPGLSGEKAVLSYVHQDPEFHRQIQQLTTAVSAAGVRVRDSGLLKSDFDENLKVYSPEEIWIFDLAVDVIAMLGCVDGLSDSSLARFKSNLRSLDAEVTAHAWKHGLKKAGTGPAQFQQLRARVPHHRPNPARY